MSEQWLITLKMYDPMRLQDVNMMPIRMERDRLKEYNVAGTLIAVELGEIVDLIKVD